MARCPYCGTSASEHLSYEAASARGSASTPSPTAIEDAEIERKLRIWTVPVLFAVIALCMQAEGFRSLARTFVAMWLHELGHACSAWMTGYGAFPGPWRTWISSDRMIGVTAVLVLVFAYWAYRSWTEDKRVTTYVASGLALLCIAGAVLVSERTALMWFTFFGDAGMMLIGAGLVLTFWAPVGSHLHVSWLRWGFVILGAIAICDGFSTWWPARTDPGVIPYGEIEGVGLSDPSKLTENYGWSEKQMIARFSAVAVLSVATVGIRWLIGLWQVRRDRLAS